MFKSKYSKKLSREINSVGVLRQEEIRKENTVVVNFGYSEALFNKLEDKTLLESAINVNELLIEYKKIFFLDEKHKDSKIIKGFDKFKDEKAILIPKNSSNGFISPGFSKWLELNKNDIRNYILTGVYADIDILQFALTLKSFFDEWNAPCEIIIPIKAVETSREEDKELKVNTLYILKNNGITLISDIK